MIVSWEEFGATCVLDLEGELTGDASDVLLRACQERIDAGAKHLVIDAKGVGIVDSRGLETLLDLTEAAIERGGRCALASPDPMFGAILDLAGLSDRLDIHDSVQEAARTLR